MITLVGNKINKKNKITLLKVLTLPFKCSNLKLEILREGSENVKVTLKAARVNANLKQSDVAKNLGCSVDRIKYIEKQSERMDYVTLLKLCSMYKCTVDDIFLPINYPESEVNVNESRI